MLNKKYKVASLFCGCGGSDLGMIGGFDYLGKKYEELPYEIVYAVDFDKWAVETYNMNFTHKAICADVVDEDFSKVPDVDVMIGGFPCQSFSTVNPTKDTNDDRANLYKQIVRFLNLKRPKFFICENVKGLITLQGGSIIKKIVGEFVDCGYNVDFKLLKAVEYGIPQKRERVIIVGIRNDVVNRFEYPHPICTEREATPLSSVIDKLAIDDPKYYFSAKAVQGVKNSKNNMKRGLWQDLSKPCLTITAHLAKTSMNSRDPILLVDASKELYRRFTPREAARIQSFPDNFCLNRSEPKSYKQIGNAVPPVFMWYVAKMLVSAIEGKEVDVCKDSNMDSIKGYNPIRNDRKLSYKQLDFFSLFDKYGMTPIVNNSFASEPISEFTSNRDYVCRIDYSKNCLVCLVKNDNFKTFESCSATIYYTGKKFPSTVHLNELYYFVPYLKGKGIRDLYFIKVARVGNRKEGQEGEDVNDIRLVFEIQFAKSLFDDYKMIDLQIWRTYTDSTLGEICNNLVNI